ncbi:MAG: hypothetical protein WBP39_06910 [Candidatus Phosphoribacter baldrii]
MEPLITPLAAVFGQAFEVYVSVPVEGTSSLVIKAVPAGQIDLTATPVVPDSGSTTWVCEVVGPKSTCTGSGPVTFSLLATEVKHGKDRLPAGLTAPDTAGTVMVELTAPDGTVTTAEVAITMPPVDPSPTSSTSTTSTSSSSSSSVSSSPVSSSSSSPVSSSPVTATVPVTASVAQSAPITDLPSSTNLAMSTVVVTVSPTGAVVVTESTRLIG